LAGGNVFTDFSTGDVRGSLLGGLNIVTKEGDGNIDVDMLTPTDTINAAVMPLPTWVRTLPMPNIPTTTSPSPTLVATLPIPIINR
jgi:hypothetical protein